MNTYNDCLNNNICVFLKLLIIIQVLKIYCYKGETRYCNISKVDKKRDIKDKKDVKNVRDVKDKVSKSSLKPTEVCDKAYNKTHKATYIDTKKLANNISEDKDNSSIKNKCENEKDDRGNSIKDEIYVEKCDGNSLIENKVKDNMKSNINMERNIKGKIPIIISEKNVFVPVETSLDLEENALEIKEIYNNVYLNESTLIPIEVKKKDLKYNTGKLFLKGFIRNCIQYSTVTSIDDIKIKGEIKHCINYIPFKCTTLINYNNSPKLTEQHNIENLVITNPTKFKLDEYIYKTKRNEPIYCNLIKVKIFTNRECCNKRLLHDKFPMESTFSMIKEKMMVQLVLQLIQKQDININCLRT
ncbi:DUF7852 domain-containing protein [Clostridium brassicae]|uniref:DUF7852 domain-containing protein n=1 Tax=Clostridium brassicae TaxID=2999072 RepID=A0ABT4D6U7_9CLOT|nr:hypothetical protein [Clostridium brassicae]MCY6958003.1 hypothetical protein [Clostridium brassicae]